ncbi:ABC transporter ATP-binding protein [Puia dinghuensis]|uniref:ABC transporter ATP-binding protein n=1 Tax=Puia dinghuensis TaxID=1792502 RepID=A0A8J2XSC8_9BACT|nr:ATP-binding cassette domain-containing protein [Puia dinghuensis]GGA94045.1 ABC transporter ATP-binding protein [Puia dinghuensis]
MVSIQNLHFAYRRRPVFSGLDLVLQPGHIYGLLGRNGTGKSTLLHNIAGYLFPQQGQIEAFGFTPRKRLPAFLGKLFHVPEDFQLPDISLAQWINHTAPFYPGFDQQQFEHYTREFAIPTFNGLRELSYGQQKKVLISLALATNAPLLLLDEPTNGLDIHSKSQFRKVIAGALDDEKCILISTHQVKDLENLIDHLMILEDGKILFHQPMSRIAETLLFKLTFDPEEEAQALYSESSLKGHALILSNHDREDSRPDLEMLYKAVLLNSKTINALFP